MTLTTEKLNEIYENPEQCSYSEIQEMAAMLANRDAQPVAANAQIAGYFVRQRPEWDKRAPWTPWKEVDAASYDDIVKIIATGEAYCGWFYDSRILYDAPPAPAVPDTWIACSERMPEPNKYVQVSNGAWVGVGMYNDADHLENDERWQDERQEFIDLLYSPVTHWMPLSAPPQEV